MTATNRIQIQLDDEWMARKNKILEYGESQRVLSLAVKDVIEMIERDRKMKYFIEENKLALGGEKRDVKSSGQI